MFCFSFHTQTVPETMVPKPGSQQTFFWQHCKRIQDRKEPGRCHGGIRYLLVAVFRHFFLFQLLRGKSFDKILSL